MAKKVIVTPMDNPPGNPSRRRGGPGTYDGEKGYPGRTRGHGGVPEKVRDEAPPLPKQKG